MVARRRTKAQRGGTRECSSSSEAETEQQKSAKTITRLARKYQNVSTKSAMSSGQSPDPAYDADQESIDSSVSSQDSKASPSSLYDFIEDDGEEVLLTSSLKVSDKKKTKSEGKGKAKGMKEPKYTKSKVTKGVMREAFVTPRTRIGKVVATSTPGLVTHCKSKSGKPKSVNTTDVLQEVSNKLGQQKLTKSPKQTPKSPKQTPVVAKVLGKRKVEETDDSLHTRSLRSAKKMKKNVVPDSLTPTVSFMDSGLGEINSKSDSGIFQSPPQTRLRFSTSLSSTPAVGQNTETNVKSMKFKAKDTSTPNLELVKPVKSRSKRVAKLKSAVPDLSPVPNVFTPPSVQPKSTLAAKVKKLKAKNTSTPIDVGRAGRKKTTHQKTVVPVFSPVERVDTPVSDYFSLDSSQFDTSISMDGMRKQPSSPTPAFSLDDDSAMFQLNKSAKKYKKSSGHSAKPPRLNVKDKALLSRAEELAMKKNLEFEELDNFELSIEG